jgi:predicted dienelactone hydrolase
MSKVRQLHLWSPLVAVCLLAGAALAAPLPQIPQNYKLKAFVFPNPGGRYAVGTLSFLVPVAGADPLRVIAWYPAQAASGDGVPYLDADEQRVQAPAIARNFLLPPGALSAIVALPTHSHENATVARGRFPLVIFSHGYWSYPRDHTALMEHLASHGYIVLSLAHPGDVADMPTATGVIATVPLEGQRQPDDAKLRAFWHGPDDPSRVKALPAFWDALHGTRLLVSLDRWRRDTMRLADAVASDHVPRQARPIAEAADIHRLAYAGWSFGGSASASACQIDRRCRAAINLDGFEFDQHLYNQRMRMPLLLIQSDFTAYPNMGPPGRDYTIYDYAYERWKGAGSTPSIYRFRIAGARHLGLTDLVLAPRDPVRDRFVGPADGNVVIRALNNMVEAFLDRYVDGKRADVLSMPAEYPGVVVRHEAVEIARWHDGK